MATGRVTAVTTTLPQRARAAAAAPSVPSPSKAIPGRPTPASATAACSSAAVPAGTASYSASPSATVPTTTKSYSTMVAASFTAAARASTLALAASAVTTPSVSSAATAGKATVASPAAMSSTTTVTVGSSAALGSTARGRRHSATAVPSAVRGRSPSLQNTQRFVRSMQSSPKPHVPATSTRCTSPTISRSSPPVLLKSSPLQVTQSTRTTYAQQPSSPDQKTEENLSLAAPVSTTYGRLPVADNLSMTAVTAQVSKVAQPQTTIGTSLSKSMTLLGEASSEASVRPQLTTNYGFPSESVECHGVFVNKPQSWSFYLPSGCSVNQAVVSATEQAYQRSALQAGEQVSVTILPSANTESLVGEWAHRNLDQPPLLIISRDQKDGGASAPAESGANNVQKVVEEQLMMLAVLQKQLIEQGSIIQNQESFISELQGRSRQQWEQLQESMQGFETDISGLKERMQLLQERCPDERSGKPGGDKKDARRRNKRH